MRSCQTTPQNREPTKTMTASFGAIALLNYTENLEKREKSTGEKSKKSSGETSPKLQISVPCLGRTCPDKIHPKSSPETKIRKNYKKYTKTADFCILFEMSSYFGFGRGFGVYFGVYFGDQKSFVFCTGLRRSQVTSC